MDIYLPGRIYYGRAIEGFHTRLSPAPLTWEVPACATTHFNTHLDTELEVPLYLSMPACYWE